MLRELILATVVSSIWLTLNFLFFGALHGFVGSLVGPLELMAWEESLGRIYLWNGVSIARISLWLYGLVVFAGVLPVNYYWMRRLRRPSE
ncbi:MAG: hypothetical protein R3178_00800 [Rhodothermales bacterium]|nr:hypothetical protein [Rhodothermales bacterium]